MNDATSTLNIDSITTPSLLKLSSIFEQKNYELRLVGGCVRDLLLNKQPNDIDLAVNLNPDQVVLLLRKNHIHVIETGIKHGTVTAIIGKHQYEITSLRKDIACDGRHAEVEYTRNWQEDAARRDFTINAMSCQLNGTLFDYFNGQTDLANKKVKFVGEPQKRIQEDALRILRFFRFSAYYSEEFDTAACNACIEQRELLKNLSGERIQNEMIKLLEAPNPTSILQLMLHGNILPNIHLPLNSCTLLEQLITLEQRKIIPINPYIRLAALLKNAILTERKALLSLSHTWRLSNKDGTHLSNLLMPKEPINPQMTVDEQKSLLRQIGTIYYTQLIYLQLATTPEHEEKLFHMLDLVNTWDIPTFPLSGRDLLAIGIPSGKTVGSFLRSAENWWEKNAYQPSKDDIITWIKQQH